MSGFAGIIAADGRDCDRRLLEYWAKSLQYRGPDGTSIHTEPGVGFCFTFLKTGPAPQADNLPRALDGRLWLIGDVRLDGRQDLRRQLSNHYRELSAAITDEDLILLSWRAWGEAAAERLLGDFAFALWNPETRQLVCARDLMGGKPLYYVHANRHFYFSNTLELLRSVPGLSLELDEVFAGDFLLQEWCLDADRTAFRHIRRLPPGHLLTYAPDRVAVRRYVELPIEEPLTLKRPEEYLERFRSLLADAVRDRLPHGPCTIFLSGGLDSTSVAATVCGIIRSEATSSRPQALTVDCRPLLPDEESDYASVAAKHLGLPMEILPRPACLPYEGWDLQVCTPEPYNDPLLLAGQLQYRRASAHSRVVLTGYGGDDILTGQSWPYLAYLLRRRRFASAAKTFGSYLWKHRRIPPLRAGLRTGLFGWIGPADTPRFPDWLDPVFSRRLDLRGRWMGTHKPPTNPHPLHPLAYDVLRSHFWSNSFEAEEPEWTRLPLQVRSPLLDLRVVRFLLRVPPVPWCMHKNLLRQTMRGVLPQEILVRRKVPLQGDLLAAVSATGQWRPSLPGEPAESVRGFVDWRRLSALLESAADSSIWGALRPVSLHHWAKSVENRGLIRYSECEPAPAASKK